MKRFLVSFALFFLIFRFPCNSYEHELSVCAIFQNDERFLKEWIDFNLVQGVDHFYLFNNLSEDDYQKVLKPYIEKGIVDLYEWPYQANGWMNWNDIQCAAYREGLKKAEGKTKWLMIIDTDEFMFCLDKRSLKNYLKSCENYSGIHVFWQCFGTGGVAEIPKGSLMIESLLMKAKKTSLFNGFYKSIFRPERVKTCNNPHAMEYKSGFFAVDEEGKCFIPGVIESPIKVNHIRINHYWSRDEKFFYEEKIPRYIWWGVPSDGSINRNNECNVEFNDDILQCIPLEELKRRG